MLKIGIDDAGRGPIIGPMILSGVILDEASELALKNLGVKDSKQLLHNKRMNLSSQIKESVLNYHSEITYPEQIDSALASGTNLNTLEAIKAAEIISVLSSKYKSEKIKVVIDCPSVNTLAWKNTVVKLLDSSILENLEIHCEHKADANHPAVSAASILAKVQREEEVEKIKKQYSNYGDIGSGYPSDPYTKEFLKKHGKALENSGIFRKSWATWKSLFEEKSQTTLF